MAQAIDKLKKFNLEPGRTQQKQQSKAQNQHQNKANVDKRHSLKQKREEIRDCLLGHVSDSGFKKGFNNI